MLPEKDIMCHRTGFQKSCFDCVTQHRCRLWTHIVGADPQTGAQIDMFGCSDEFTNKLLIENAQQSRQNGASADKVATEIRHFHVSMLKQNQELLEGVNQVDVPSESKGLLGRNPY